MTSSSRLRPLPALPWDVLLVVLEHADSPALSRVCYDFLIISGHRLYHSITIRNLEQLRLLFCESKLSSTSRLSPYLSLSQTRHLTIDFAHSPLAAPPPSSKHLLRSLILSSNRLLPSLPILPLETLRILLNTRTKPILNPLQTTLFPLLNPRLVEFACSSPSSSSHINTHGGLSLFSDLGEIPSHPHLKLNAPLHSWSSLKHISFQGIVPFRYLQGNCLLASLPRDALPSLNAIRFYVGAGGSRADEREENGFCWAPRKSGRDFLEHWMGNAKAFGLETMKGERGVGMVFVVERDGMRNELENELERDYPEWMGRVGVEVER